MNRRRKGDRIGTMMLITATAPPNPRLRLISTLALALVDARGATLDSTGFSVRG